MNNVSEIILIQEVETEQTASTEKENTVESQEKPISSDHIKCTECDLNVANEAQLKTHKRLKHEEVINFTCSECAYSYTTKNQLSLHSQNIHIQEETVLKCSKCDFSSISASADGGPRSRVCARETLRSAPHRR